MITMMLQYTQILCNASKFVISGSPKVQNTFAIRIPVTSTVRN